jgi:hypothetical protein
MKILVRIRKVFIATIGYILVFITLPALVKVLTGIAVLSILSGIAITTLATVFFSLLEGEV